MKYIIKVLLMLLWISGIVIAKGFWSTFFSIFFFPWSWYLVVEKVLIAGGML